MKKTIRALAHYLGGVANAVLAPLGICIARTSIECVPDKEPTPEPPPNAALESIAAYCDHLKTIIEPEFFYIKHAIHHLYIQSKCEYQRTDGMYSFINDDKIVKMYLPLAMQDDIQSVIAATGAFWDIASLRKSIKYIRANAVILDIGANIGNHSIFWSLFSPAARILSFEPQRLASDVFKRNIELNKCDNIELFNKVVSDREGRGAKIVTAVPNIMNSKFVKDQDGGYETMTIDSLNLEKVDFIKIDVEGFQDDVIKGMRDTITRNSPVLWTEIIPGQFATTSALLGDLGYSLVEEVTSIDFVFTKK